jgi:hypothetical protein
MDQTNEAALPGGVPTDIVQVPPPAGEAISTRDAARSLASFRLKQRASESASPQAEAAAVPPADQSADAAVTPDPSAQARAEADAALPDADPGATGETTASVEPPAEPASPAGLALPAGQAPIEPPRSWTKEARERFASLPRETQEYLAQREQERDRELRRTQNEAAEQRKGLEAERQKAEQVRTQYEAALPDMLGTLQREQASAFPDVKSVIDVERLAREDWPRYVAWDAQQKRIASAQQEVASAGLRQEQDRQIRLAEYSQRELGLVSEKAPELADPAQRAKFEHAAVGVLRDLGFSDQELVALHMGRTDLSLHDHRVQLLIREGVRFRDAQKAAKQASLKPVPPVQRPGVAPQRGAVHDAVVQNLTKRLDQTGTLKDAARLLAERRKAAR